MPMARYATSKKGFLITALISAAMIALVIFGVIGPLFWYVRSASENLKGAIGERTNEAAKFRQRNEQAQEVSAAQASIDRLAAFFSRDDLRDLSSLFDQFERLAATQGVTLKAPIAEMGGDKTRTILIFSVEGEFENVMSFLKRLEQFPRFSRVEGVSFAGQKVLETEGGVATRLLGSITLSLFIVP